MVDRVLGLGEEDDSGELPDITAVDNWIEYFFDDAPWGLNAQINELVERKITFEAWSGASSGQWDEESIVACNGTEARLAESTTGGLLVPIDPNDGSISTDTLESIRRYFAIWNDIRESLGHPRDQ